MEYFQLAFSGFAVIMVLLTALWLLSVYLKNASIIDPFWGTGFIVLMGYYLYETENYTPRVILLFILVVIWGLRLSIFLFWRNMGHGEDYRYQQFRKDYGPELYWWVSFFQVFLLQGVLMLIVSLPLLGVVLTSTDAPLVVWDYLAVAIWLIGISFEAGGDWQLSQFKKDPNNKGKVLDTGFWKYTRHPNYFGDAAVWWSFGLLAVISGSYIGIIGSLIMNVLLIKISGVSLLERTLVTTKPQYEAYIKRTRAFVPWFPKANNDQS